MGLQPWAVFEDPVGDEQRRIESLDIPEDDKDALYQATARFIEFIDKPYSPSEYRWGASPPNDDLCRECYVWRRYPIGQRHFGYTWWRECDWAWCKHAHHDEEIWIA